MRTKQTPASHAIVALALCSSVALSIACGTARRREPLRIPAAMNPQAVRGQVVFMNHCHQCHPGGEAGLAPAINDKPFPEFLKKFQVRHGLGTMPSFSEGRISDDELDDLMEYLDTLRRSTRSATLR